MPMHITEHQYLRFLLNLQYDLFQRIYLRMQPLTRQLPLPIQITPRKITPIIPMNDAIWIDHRYDLKHKIIPQLIGVFIVTREIVDDAFGDVGGDGLAGVDSAGDDDGLFGV